MSVDRLAAAHPCLPRDWVYAMRCLPWLPGCLAAFTEPMKQRDEVIKHEFQIEKLMLHVVSRHVLVDREALKPAVKRICICSSAADTSDAASSSAGYLYCLLFPHSLVIVQAASALGSGGNVLLHVWWC